MATVRPIAALTIATTGAAFQAVLVLIAAIGIAGNVGFSAWLLLAAIIICLGIFGSLLMNSSNQTKVRAGSVAILISSLLSSLIGWGFIVGSLLMFTGGFLGVAWSPTSNPSIRRSVH